MSLLVSCEVGSDRAPTELLPPAMGAALAELDRSEPRPGAEAGRKEPRLPVELPATLACDAVAGELSKQISQHLGAPLINHQYSLDLIDVSKSLHHRQLFSRVTRSWPTEYRQWLIEEIHAPYRLRIQQAVTQLLNHFSHVIHLSIRTFASKKNGKLQRGDVGLLYDPSQEDEVDLCLDWIDDMYYELPMLRVRRNYPGRGTNDSITKSMRTHFANQNYIGIEVQLNRAWVGRRLPIRDEVIKGMCESLHAITTSAQSDAA